jgi:hypothetical protein
MSTPVAISTAPVPAGFCFTSWELSWPVLAGLLSGLLSGGLNTFTVSTTTPTPDNRDKPWLNLTDGRWYIFLDGYWVSRHPIVPGLVVMYEGIEVDIPTLDGGEGGAITTVTGAFWEKVMQANGRIPIGPGTLPSGATIALGGTTGADTKTLAVAELPAHKHTFLQGQVVDTGAVRVINSGNNFALNASQETSEVGSNQVFSIMPPVYGIWSIRRTGRIWYRV